MAPLLSLILCSRNDSYEGDSVGRLQAALNYTARAAHAARREADVEILVCDWGSETPLADVLSLVPETAAITRFIHVAPELAKALSADSPFPEVRANNAAVRRSKGRYIGRIDQDTLVGQRFFERFFELVERNEPEFDKAFHFIGRRSIPLRFAARRVPVEELERFVDVFRWILPREGLGQNPWYDAPVGVVLLHRDQWEAARGYDENLIFWGFMEAQLAARIGRKHSISNLERRIGCDCYHLSHSARGLIASPRRRNDRSTDGPFAPNSAQWGLVGHELPILTAKATPPAMRPERAVALATRVGLLLHYGPTVAMETLWHLVLGVSRVALRPLKLRAWQVEALILRYKR